MTGIVTLLAGVLGVNRTFAGVIAIGFAINAASGAAWGIYELIKHRGADEVRTEVERKNNDAGIKGGETRMSRADCVAAERVWDFGASKCGGPAAGDRQ